MNDLDKALATMRAKRDEARALAEHAPALLATLQALCKMNAEDAQAGVLRYAVGSPYDKRWKAAHALVAKVTA